MTETRERPRPAAYPELEGEAEVELGRYAVAVAARWWLPLLGLIVGAAIGWGLSLGGEEVYRAQALVYTGDPFAPSGARVATVGTTVSSIREIVSSEAAVRRAASVSGLTASEVRRGIFVQQSSGGGARVDEPSLVNVGVRGDAPGRVAEAATELARVAVDKSSNYVDAKIAGLRGQMAAANEERASLDRRIEAALEAAEGGTVSDTDRLAAIMHAGVLETRRATVLQTLSDRQQQLALAEEVERPRLVQPAVARKVTAQSRRNQLVVAGAIGLLLGIAAALAWDPVARRVRD
jgi:hypothetical protein